jgi:hypothetical protein
VSPLAPPGEYTVRLTVGGEELTRSLIVLKDPHSTGTEADIRAQFRVILELREEAEAVVDLINEAEIIRAQLDDMEAYGRLPGGQDGAQIRAAATALDEALIGLEMGLTDLRLSGGSAGQDALRWPRQLFAKITSLAGYVGSSDFRPTDQHLEVHQRYKELLADAQARMGEIRTGELAELNRILELRGIPHISGRGGS